MKSNFILVKINSRKYAIMDVITKVFYFGKKTELEKRLIQLNGK